MKILLAFLLLTGITVSFKRATDRVPKTSQRKTIATIKNQEGIVRNMGSKENPVYIIHCQTGNMKLAANNIPSAFQKDSLSIVFSGQVKEAFAAEKGNGQCFVINSIRQLH